MIQLQGKVILVHDAVNFLTHKITLALLEAGASVILSSRRYLNFELLKERSKELNALDRLHVLSFSIRSSEDMLLAKKSILRGWGGLDAVISLPEHMESTSGLSSCEDRDWDKAFNQCIKRYFALARSFIPVLAMRRPSLYITVSPSSVLHTCPGSGMEDISHAVQFMLAQSLCLESKDYPSLHNLVLSPHDTDGDTWITASNVSEAIVTLIRNAEWNRGHPEFQSNWRDRMEEPEQGIYVGGI